jgi:hypothetical protein
MKRIRGKVQEIIKEDPESEPDRARNSWLIEGKLDEDVVEWESVRPVFQDSEFGAEVEEASLSGPKNFTVRTIGQPRLKTGDELSIAIRSAQES